MSGFAPSPSEVLSLSEIKTEEMARISTGLQELDHVLGGGLLLGAVILVGGDPGIGKSTLLLQAIAALSQTQRSLYMSGEESLAQISLRAQRLGIQAECLRLVSETSLERIFL